MSVERINVLLSFVTRHNVNPLQQMQSTLFIFYGNGALAADDAKTRNKTESRGARQTAP
jgi:hypothetical protein